jgi:hypothetical protein
VRVQRAAQVLLSASARHAVRRSYDGRRPGHNGSEVSAVTVGQIRASRAGIAPPHSPAGAPPGPLLTAGELTILTSWAEALAEALAVAPNRIETLAADAQAGAPWRGELRICEPSASLRHAISAMFPAAATAGHSPPDTALLEAHGTEPGQPPLDRLARAALRSALRQRQARQADQGRDHGTSSLPVCRATRGVHGKPAPRRQASKTPGHPAAQNQTLSTPNPCHPEPTR